jgi:hypothetical protein
VLGAEQLAADRAREQIVGAGAGTGKQSGKRVRRQGGLRLGREPD